MARSAVSATRTHAPAVALGVALAAIAFGARGGSEIGRTTTVEMCVIVVSGIVIAASVAIGGGPRRVWGGVTLAALAALCVLTATSMLWSIVPELTWLNTSLVLAYLWAFAAAACVARLAPGSWPQLIRGILLGIAIVAGYALISRVFPGSLAGNEAYARIGQPFGYWNAVGAIAAIGIVPILWLGAREDGERWARALAYPLAGVLVVALMLSYSRGALAAAAIAVVLWLIYVPLRLRSAGVILIAIAGAAPVTAWSLSQKAFTEDGASLAVRESAAGTFGLLLVLTLLVLLGAGFVADRLLVGRELAPRARRRVLIGTLVLAAVLALAGFGKLASSPGGIDGTISARFDELTSESSSVPGGPGRLTVASSSRGKYWRQASRIFKDHQALGSGAGTFRVARLRYRRDELVSGHAHGYVAQTMADLGVAGLLISLVLAGAWLAAAVRTTGVRVLGGRISTRLLRDPMPPPDWTAERTAITALGLAVVAFGLHSIIDWTWFVPGTAITALVAAGFVAARGPLSGDREEARASLKQIPPGRAAGALAVLISTGLLVWAVWQPARADREATKAGELLAENKLPSAIKAAERANEIDPFTLRPLLLEASAQLAAGRPIQAEKTLATAVREHPGDPLAWLRLADFQLKQGRPREAITTLAAVFYLDPRNRPARRVFLVAQVQLRAQAQPGTAQIGPQHPNSQGPQPAKPTPAPPPPQPPKPPDEGK